jgi:8-oxo-dGTP pyrophosphatase MutT (NUDIX family)
MRFYAFLQEGKMETSAAVIITDGERFVVGHPTGAPYRKAWSLPKGLVEPGESAVNAAAREVEEETSLKLDKSKLEDKGVYPYQALKNIHLFVYHVDDLSVSTLRCTSTFEQKPGVWAPEIDKFAWIPYSKAAEYLNPNLNKIFKEVEPSLTPVTECIPCKLGK